LDSERSAGLYRAATSRENSADGIVRHFPGNKDVMLQCRFRAALIALGLWASALALGTTAAPPATADERTHAAPPYTPGLGELMGANQMRHAKYGLPGRPAIGRSLRTSSTSSGKASTTC
jgi:hypothetical protein